MNNLDIGRRCGAEFLGTFAIVFFGCGAVAALGPDAGPAGLVAVALAFSLTVAAMIYALGHISAAHFNPAVTLGLASAGRFPWRFTPHYIAAQCVGAIAASGLHKLMLRGRAEVVEFGATLPSVDVASTIGFEVILTMFLVLVIVSVATDKRVNGAVPGAAIGITVALCIFAGGPLTGASMNPARSLGPAVFSSAGLTNLWIYIVGPIIGGLLGAAAYEALRGSSEHAQGAPNDLYVALAKANRSENSS